MRNFLQVLADVRRGVCVEDMTDKLGELVENCQRTERAGSITLTLNIKPNGDGAVFVTDEIKMKLPREKKGDSFFFVSPDGSLVRSDPRQRDIEEVLNDQSDDRSASSK